MLHGQPLKDEKVYKVGGAVSRPRAVYKVDPEYTPEALSARREGYVLIELVVTRNGMPSKVHEVTQKLGFGLDEKAIEAVENWRFDPGKKSGEPVAVMTAVDVEFHLPR